MINVKLINEIQLNLFINMNLRHEATIKAQLKQSFCLTQTEEKTSEKSK